MSHPHAHLLERILAFEFDQGQPALTFAQRLARENHWSLDFAERAILEYKRFVFLACTANHVVTPSDQVDQVWHLHLTYTRSYWAHFCGKVLGRPLHHDPTRGGAAEDSKYRELYERTLASYAACFGESAPVEFWPNVEKRFAPQHHQHTSSSTLRSSQRTRRVLTGATGLAAGLMLIGLTGGLTTSATREPLARAGATGALLGTGFLLMLLIAVWFLNRGKGGKGGKGGRGAGGAAGTTGCGGGGCSSSSRHDSNGCSTDSGGSSGCSSDGGGSSGCGGGGCGGGGD